MRRVLSLMFLCTIAATGEGEGTPPPTPGADPEPESASPAAEPDLGLDRLLRVPRSSVDAPELRGGKDRAAWEAEFTEARQELDTLERRIEETQTKLREASPDDWAFSPTGGGAPSDPEVLKLRASLKRDRQSLEAARQRLREIEVEASLAGVPDSWRGELEAE
jgi:hypothetical protein